MVLQATFTDWLKRGPRILNKVSALLLWTSPLVGLNQSHLAPSLLCLRAVEDLLVTISVPPLAKVFLLGGRCSHRDFFCHGGQATISYSRPLPESLSIYLVPMFCSAHKHYSDVYYLEVYMGVIRGPEPLEHLFMVVFGGWWNTVLPIPSA